MSNFFTPRPYQTIALDFIYDTPRAALFADIGMGKTVSALTAYDNLSLAGYENKPALILGTLRVARSVWKNEIPKWRHLSNIEISTIVGNTEERRAALKRDASVYTMNFENIPWLLEQLNGKWPFGMVIADESTRLKGLRMSVRTSSTGKRFLQGQGTLRSRKLAKVAYENRNGRWLNMSGTPSPNGLKDLYGQIWFQDFGHRLGNSFEAFKNRWFKTGYDGYTLEPLPHAEKEIHEKIKDICLSIRAVDFFDVQEPIYTNIPIELPGRARALYRDMEKKFFARLGTRSVEAFNAASQSIKLLQLANGAIYLDPETENDESPKAKEWREVHDRKIEALESIIEECAGMPLIVAYQFRSDLARLQKAFPKGRLLKTQKDEENFKKGKINLLFAHPASAGHGIDGFQNVTNRIAFFGQWWDLELRDQIIGRIGPVRQIQAGFDRPVYVYDICAVDTLDEDVLISHKEKRSVQDCLLEAMRRRA